MRKERPDRTAEHVERRGLSPPGDPKLLVFFLGGPTLCYRLNSFQYPTNFAVVGTQCFGDFRGAVPVQLELQHLPLEIGQL